MKGPNKLIETETEILCMGVYMQSLVLIESLEYFEAEIVEVVSRLFYFRILMSFQVVPLNNRRFLELTFISGAD